MEIRLSIMNYQRIMINSLENVPMFHNSKLMSQMSRMFPFVDCCEFTAKFIGNCKWNSPTVASHHQLQIQCSRSRSGG